MAVIGTAGHVDHGKSTLVQALTGRDPDRWKEEKERGVTIDLGFAWTNLGDTEVSFVDVPGHERFMKNMLAGIEAIDVALLVVAADEGWKPQSEEHLAVLDLLGVDAGVVAVTKVDRCDADLVELAKLEIEDKLAGTSLAGAPILGLSAHSGEGLPALREILERLVNSLPEVTTERPRLWVDRSFSVSGAGTVVTGTLLDGSLSVDDRLVMLPEELEVRIRSIQSHESSRSHIGPRRRVALNLAGVDRTEVSRGSMLGRPGHFVTTSRFTSIVRPARYIEALTDRGAYHLHIGSGAWPARVRLLDHDVALVETAHPLPLVLGDKFILRESGRRLVTAGGTVVDANPPRRGTAALAAARESASADSPALALLQRRGRYSHARLAAETGGMLPPMTVLDGLAYHSDEVARLAQAASAIVARYHLESPLRAGIPSARLGSELGVGGEALGHIIEAAGLQVENAEVRAGDHALGLDAAQEQEWRRAERILQKAGAAAVPRVAELDLDRELLHLLIRLDRLRRISTDFVFLPDQVRALTDAMASFAEPFTVAEFKDATGLSRKYAVPFLEWTDSQGLTVRMGDRRRLR